MERLLRNTLAGGRFIGVEPTRSQTMSAIRGKNNRTTELRFRMALVRSALRGWVTHPDLLGKPDFYFPSAKVVVFLDGCFWHGCKVCGHIPKTNSAFWSTKIRRNKYRDRRNTRALRASGFSVLRFWEHSLGRHADLQWSLRKVRNAVASTRKGV